MKTILNKRESTMSIMGAIIGCGLIDSCGRNATISLLSFGGQKRMQSIVGMVIFWQYWYWYPLIPFIALCFEPTMIMSLNHDLVMPKMQFRSNASSSLYAYPEPLKEEEAQEKKTLEKAVLSITAKQKARDLKREKTRRQVSTEGDTATDVEMTDKTNNNNNNNAGTNATATTTSSSTGTTEPSKDIEGNATVPTTDKEKEKEKEKPFEILENPSRVTLNQRKVMRWEDSRYQPVRGNNNDGRLYGIIVVEDSSPDKPEELVQAKTLDDRGVHGNEPLPPKPFKYLGP